MRMHLYRVILVLLLCLFAGLSSTNLVQAARGMPGTAEFGYGAILYPNGPYLNESAAAARELELDWVYIPITWEAIQPGQDDPPQLDWLDAAIQSVGQSKTGIVLSVSGAPAWAQTENGPNPAEAARFVSLLVGRYPGLIQAVELFPGANMAARWGGQPSPLRYAALFKAVGDAVRATQSQIFLVAGGLQPFNGTPAAAGMDDLTFLQGLYDAGAAEWMPVISLQFSQVDSDPLTLPSESAGPVLRHYEKVRAVMVKNHHRNGYIWITRLNLPYSKIEGNVSSESDLHAQAVWLSKVYLQLRGQLYIGAAFLQSINSEKEGAAAQFPFLVRSGSNRHPFFSVFHEMIRNNNAGTVPDMPGKPKDGSLEKKRP